jgi:hypothetical protein
VEAIIGLIGVIVGGTLSALASYLASRSLEGRRIAAHRRAAARLVNQELNRVAHTLSAPGAIRARANCTTGGDAGEAADAKARRLEDSDVGPRRASSHRN